MPKGTIADYIVIFDPNVHIEVTNEESFRFSLPRNLRTGSDDQRPIISFMFSTSPNATNLRFEVNCNNEHIADSVNLNLNTHFKQAYWEGFSGDILRANGTNTIRLNVEPRNPSVESEGSVIFSDLILWYQRSDFRYSD